MFSAGCSKAEISRELGVTRPTITDWSRKDRWDQRLGHAVEKAEQVLETTGVNTVAGILDRIRGKMKIRLDELETLCASPVPSIRLRAIQLWLKLAGVDRPMPDPIQSSKDPATLKLIEDLIERA